MVRLALRRLARLPWPSVAVSLGLAVASCWLLLTWADRVPRGLVMSGMWQGDFPTYLCYGRAAAATSPLALTYANPHDLRPDAAAWLVNLPITFIGWMLEAGVSPNAVEMLMRLVFGFLMYLALAWMTRKVFGDSFWRWLGFAAVGLCAGAAWLWVLHERPDGLPRPELEWMRIQVQVLERPYGWWFLDVARNLMYPLELVYHALVFTMLGALVARKWWLAVAMSALCAWSNPFVGLQFCPLAIACLFLMKGPTWRPRAAAIAIFLVLVGYYKLVLPRDPVIHHLETGHSHAYLASLSGQDFLLGHALSLPGLAAAWLWPSFRRELLRIRVLWPMTMLFVVTLALVENTRWAPSNLLRLMPMHFTRGYMHVATWTFTVLMFRHVARTSRWLRWPAMTAGVLLALVALPDNVLFFDSQYKDLPHVPSLVWSEDWQATLDVLRGMPGERHVLAADWHMGRHVCAMTRHRSAFGTEYTTPYYGDRMAEVNDFRVNPDAAQGETIRWADTVLVPAGDWGWTMGMRRSPHWREVSCNRAWCVFARR